MNDHPMPPPVARLPRAGTTPVPWTVQWSSGTEHVVERESGPVLVCTCKAGKGRPRFGDPCANRQRQAVAERRCTVCGTPIDADQVCTWTLADTATQYYVEAPAHPQCLAFALRTCPKLASIAHRTHVVQARDYLIWERRALGTSPNGELVFEMVPFGDPSPGVIELYALTPVDPEFTPAAVWLADHVQDPW
ncbi:MULTISPECIES: hypothetical protein [unclassified Nocardiopsis]|uniref:hypothetical protein n=1 Tax=unclassified Nocardiopsis TaxID=2649073 RepID=UPI001356B71D|nr:MULTISPECIES: hypothetical protein [unclassified Nocardiopsis]